MTIEADIKEQARQLGFDAAGITTAEPVEQEQVDFYKSWLADGRAAQMGYLQRNLEKRFNPGALLNGARSVICVALSYRPGKSEIAPSEDVRIARYARYEDYHPFIKNRLFQLAEYIQQHTKAANAGKRVKFKACTDSAPLAERALARRAGLGFIGKNHMLIHPELGGQILLGELLTTLELVPDEPLKNRTCGGCNQCVRACPTGALSGSGAFDARKCLSYLTTEEPNDIPEMYRSQNPGYIFGCDECLLACPYELTAPPRRNRDFMHHPEWQTLTREKICGLSESEFERTFANSGFIRLGRQRLRRNCGCGPPVNTDLK